MRSGLPVCRNNCLRGENKHKEYNISCRISNPFIRMSSLLIVTHSTSNSSMLSSQGITCCFGVGALLRPLCRVSPDTPSSFISLHFQVSLGRLCLRFSLKFHSSVYLVMLEGSFRSVPNQSPSTLVCVQRALCGPLSHHSFILVEMALDLHTE